MQQDRRTPLSADEFFELVEKLLAPPMAALGYNRIHGTVNDQPGSRSALTSTGDRAGDEAPFLWFQYGFEANGDEVRRLVGPEDPESEDEWWVNYEPSTGLLDLGAWRPVAKEQVNWDIWLDHGPCSAAEVERRLDAVGQAVLAFVQEHGGFPTAP